MYNFQNGDNEWNHSYPGQDKQQDIPFEDQIIFPAPRKDGVIVIFDGWSALTRKQISLTCPFYDIELGCKKCQELNKERISDEDMRKKVNAQKKAESKIPVVGFSLSNSAIETVSNFSEDFNQEEVLLFYVEKILKENPDKADELTEIEIPHIFNALERKKAGLEPITKDLLPQKKITIDDFKKISGNIQTEKSVASVPPDKTDSLLSLFSEAEKNLEVSEKTKENKAETPVVPRFVLPDKKEQKDAPAAPKFAFSSKEITVPQKPTFSLSKITEKE